MTAEKALVASCGTFDGTIHPGHLFFLNTSRIYGNLVVFVVTDDVIRKNKRREPIFSQAERTENLRSLQIADKVIPLVGSDAQQLQQIAAVYPTKYCFGGNQFQPFDEKLQVLLAGIGCSIIRLPMLDPEQYSTSKLHFPDAINTKCHIENVALIKLG